MAIKNGTDGNDTISGTSAADEIYGLGGDDTLNGLGGNDILDGGAGNDSLSGGDGDDVLRSGLGHNSVDGGAGTDRLEVDYAVDLGSGRPQYLSFSVYANGVWTEFDSGGMWGWSVPVPFDGLHAALVNAEQSAISLKTWDFYANTYTYASVAFTNIERLTVIGGVDGDLLVIQGDQGIYNGGGGEDFLYADLSTTKAAVILDNSDPAQIHTLPNGTTFTNIEHLLLATGAGDDNIAVSNYIFGFIDNDIRTGAGNDTVTAGAGWDNLDGGEGNDTLNGGDGNNTLNGGAGNDTLTSGVEIDILNGGDGDDVLKPGGGWNWDNHVGDSVDGGAGMDQLEVDHSMFKEASGISNNPNLWLSFSTNTGGVWTEFNGDGNISNISRDALQLALDEAERERFAINLKENI